MSETYWYIIKINGEKQNKKHINLIIKREVTITKFTRYLNRKKGGITRITKISLINRTCKFEII